MAVSMRLAPGGGDRETEAVCVCVLLQCPSLLPVPSPVALLTQFRCSCPRFVPPPFPATSPTFDSDP